MFRRTDCHFSLRRADIDPDDELYVPALTTLLNAEEGRVYLDVARPRVCIRGAEERERSDLGYRWLEDDEVFPLGFRARVRARARVRVRVGFRTE